jgi:hypothetical protein
MIFGDASKRLSSINTIVRDLEIGRWLYRMAGGFEDPLVLGLVGWLVTFVVRWIFAGRPLGARILAAHRSRHAPS